LFWAVKNDKVRRYQGSNVYKKPMKPIKIYTTQYCGFCARAKELLREKGLVFEEVDVTLDDAMRDKLVEMAGGRRTVPQIFIGSVHVGGYSDLAQWNSEGKLDRLINEPSP
jgi:glutaredoxin 3